MKRFHELVVAVSFLLLSTMLLPGLASSAAEDRSEAIRPAPVFGPVVKLFNGKDLQGWTAFFNNGSVDPSDAFFVEEGILKCKGNPIGYIQTKKKYESFELHVEWRFVPEKGAGNSGVLLRVTGEDKVWPRSIEAQLHSRNAGDIWNIGEYPMKANADRTKGRRTIKAHKTNEKPLGEWNSYRILLDGKNLTLEVNGLIQNKATDCEVVPGRIGFQSEGAWIEFRRIELRPIIGVTRKKS